jgi:hypothetical protein
MCVDGERPGPGPSAFASMQVGAPVTYLKGGVKGAAVAFIVNVHQAAVALDDDAVAGRRAALPGGSGHEGGAAAGRGGASSRAPGTRPIYPRIVAPVHSQDT